MTPIPPSSSDGSAIPPRHRPTLSEHSKNSGEADLWDLEDESPASQGRVEITPEPRRQAVPAPRNTEKAKPQPDAEAPAPEPPMKSLSEIGASQRQAAKLKPSQLAPRPERDKYFDDLDDWIESPAAPAPAPVEPPASVAVPAAPPAEAPEVKDELPAAEEEAAPVTAEPAAPISLRPTLNLTPIERVGLIALLVLLLIGGGVLVFKTFGRLPTEARRVEADNFPVRGKLVTILSADSYWRVPLSEGAKAEIVRRGTALIPVLELTASGGPAGIRVIFRDSDGKVVGDVVTRTVKVGEAFEVAATAGFEDVGMHAAYRTGQSKPWTIQLYEAASANSPSQDFKKLFEMRISIARR